MSLSGTIRLLPRHWPHRLCKKGRVKSNSLEVFLFFGGGGACDQLTGTVVIGVKKSKKSANGKDIGILLEHYDNVDDNLASLENSSKELNRITVS